MVLADSSVWIDHFRGTLDGLDEMLDARSIVMHDHVLGELALGALRDRTKTLWDPGSYTHRHLRRIEDVNSQWAAYSYKQSTRVTVDK